MNLTSKTVTKGSAPVMTLAVNPLTNRITGQSYDANGNLLSLPAGGTGTYDAENRLVGVPGATYGYDGSNKRIWRWTGSVDGYGFGNASGLQLYLYRLDGKQLGTYVTSIYTNTGVQMAPLLLDSAGTLNLYFGGKKKVGTGQAGALVAFVQDRLGSSVKTYPYGEEKVPNGVDGWKFATYLRDTGTNLDYADQRFYANTQGRFLSADPYAASGGAGDPGSWNRYGYVQGDPVNFRDSRGLFVENTSGCGAPDTDYCIDDGYSAGGGGGGGCWVDTFNPLPGPVCTFFSVPYTPVATPAPAPLRPASIRIEKASDGTQRDCYTSLQDTNAGSLAERDILYGVYDQNGDFMSGVIIRELLTLFDGNCPNGTQQVGNQCIGSYNKPGGYFLDSLSASPGTSGSKFDQIFQVTTLPSVAGYQGVYNLGLRIENNYTSSGSGSNALVVTPGVITVNNNNGGFRRCTGGRP